MKCFICENIKEALKDKKRLSIKIKKMTFKLHGLNYWMLLDTGIFWSLVLTSMIKMEGLVQVQWDTLM